MQKAVPHLGITLPLKYINCKAKLSLKVKLRHDAKLSAPTFSAFAGVIIFFTCCAFKTLRLDWELAVRDNV